MIIYYTPEDGPPREFEFLPSRLISPEAEAIEKVGRGGDWDTFEEFGQKFLKGSIRAYRAALWVMLKRENPTLRFSDLVFRVGEVSVDYSKTELIKIREALEKEDDEDTDISIALAQVNSALKEKVDEEVIPDLKDPTEKLEEDSSTSAMRV